MAKMVSYYKLGSSASSFYDPILKLKIPSHRAVAKLEGASKTRRIENALKFRHIEEATEEEYQAYLVIFRGDGKLEADAEPATGGDILENKNKGQLVKFYKDNYEVSEDELKRFSKLTREEMVAELTEAEIVE